MSNIYLKITLKKKIFTINSKNFYQKLNKYKSYFKNKRRLEALGSDYNIYKKIDHL